MEINNRVLRVLIFVSLATGLISLSFASELPQPKYPVSGPVFRELVVENVYVCKVMKYESPAVLRLVTQPDQASYSLPEDAVAAHFSAIFAKNYDWFLNTWSKDSQKFMADKNREKSRGPDYWLNLWENVYADKKIELITRIESGNYVLIEYRLTPKGRDKPFQDTVALTKENDRWVLTQELRNDPVLSSWNAPGLRVQRLVR
jgi:hypothetical protein